VDASVANIIAQTPILADAGNLAISPFGGLTNTNYLVTADGERFVVRVGGRNSDLLDISREFELEALTAASAAGIGPEVVRFVLPEGHLVTRLIEGRHLTAQEYRTPGNLQHVAKVVKRLHGLPPVKGTFSPFRRVESYAGKVRAFGASLPEDFEALLERMRRIEADQRGDDYPWLRFCHNDLFSVNFLDDGSIRIVDWEFAGMGDIYFDLAALVYAYDSDGPLPLDEQLYLLECYFGEVTAFQQTRLDGMKFALLFFTAMWGLLQHAAQQEGIVALLEGFDCLAYAQDIFGQMRNSEVGLRPPE
jgi:thiamine kinase-like enzyme